MNDKDKRVVHIQKIMALYNVFVFVTAIIVVIISFAVYATLLFTGNAIPTELRALIVAEMICSMVLYIVFCIISPMVDWLKEKKKEKNNTPIGKERE